MDARRLLRRLFRPEQEGRMTGARAVPVLECQDCGQIVRQLDAREARMVAERPYDFVVLCRRCSERFAYEEAERAR